MVFPISNVPFPAELGGPEKSTVSLSMIGNVRLGQGLTVKQGRLIASIAIATGTQIGVSENTNKPLEGSSQH